ncbi:MAG: alkaline phosphatase family protein [Acidobacteriota bacterium]
MIGLDGATWDMARPLAASGQLPSIAKLLGEGTHATLESMDPMYSPRLWTTISTGRLPRDHGIETYIDLLPGTGKRAELALYGLPSTLGTLSIRVLSPEPQMLRASLDGAAIGDAALAKGWQEVTLRIPARAPGARNILALDHQKRTETGATRPILGGGAPEKVAHTAGYDVLTFHADGREDVRWDLGDYQACGDWLKSGFYIEREVAEDGADFLWAGREASVPVSGAWRRVPAIWTILGARGRKVGVIGHWATWPAERVNGFLVSDRVIYGNFNRDRSGIESDRGRTYPPELAVRLVSTLVSPDDLPADLLESYGVHAGDVGFRHELARHAKVRSALASTVNYRAWALDMLAREEPDFFMVYFDAIDVISHVDYGQAFGPPGPDPRSTVARTYRMMDDAIGEILARARPRHRVLLVSDHGFEVYPPAELAKIPTEMRATNTGRHEKRGIFLVAGEGIAAGREIAGATLLDITPTMLALFDLPAGRDMPGRVLDVFSPPHPELARVDTYGAPTTSSRPEGPADEALEEHLRSLGYIE